MPEFFLELFSEEIPARMQAECTEKIRWAVEASLGKIGAKNFQMFYGPRRQAISGHVDQQTQRNFVEVRGPKEGALSPAIEGFARKQGVSSGELVLEDGYWWFRQNVEPVSAGTHIKTSLESVLTSNFWPKSMRWGQSGDFTWIRPLRRIVCLLDGEVVPLTLGPVTAGNETEGHRVHAPGAFTVSSVADWAAKLRAHYVIVDQDERKRLVKDGLAEAAAKLGLTVAPDDGLLDEVTGLVEWPVPLIGRIGEEFMDLPPEVRELSMKVNQKYFALRDAEGKPAPYFAFMANLEAPDGGATIIAGNERVLRARLSDARHFWDLDLKTPLDALLPRLEKITFHAKIGTQRQRADRISHLAEMIVYQLASNDFTARASAKIAGLLCKADLVTGMVGEFPELQGIMGGYYAAGMDHPEAAIIGAAIKTHYQPKGPSDDIPTAIVAITVALADKLDTLREFFAYGEKPTGSSDPYALRRCALGVIRIIIENGLRLHLRLIPNYDEAILDFITERLRIKLRGEGKRFDILDAVLASGTDDDLVRLMKRVDALGEMLNTEDGRNLFAAYKRAANILRIENAKDGPHNGVAEGGLFRQSEEFELSAKLQIVAKSVVDFVYVEDFATAMHVLASLRPAIDAFFDKVIVNAEQPDLRQNRLRLLAQFVGAVQQVADFTKIEG